MAYLPPTVGEVAGEIATCLGEGDEDAARRLAFRFVEVYERAAPDERLPLVAERPGSTGDPRFDALVAGIVEYVSARHGMPVPAWVNDPDRFLPEWWFVSGMRALHANAIVHSPASFKRRGVFLTEGSLTYA